MTTVAPMTERVSSRSAPTRLDTVDVRWMIGLGAVALIVRLWFVLSVGQTTFAFNDAAVYNTIAVSLAHGHGFRGIYGQLTAQWPPGYPFVLSLAYRIFGAHPTTGEVLNAVLGAGTVPILYFAARRTLGRVEAIFVGAGMTLLLGQVFWADVLISEALYAFVLAILLALLAVLPSARPRSAVLVGLALGAATLTRGEGFLLLAVPLAMWWPQLPRRVLLRQAAILCAVILAFVVPWTIRNAEAMHAFVPLSTNFSSTFWSGHNPNADGGPNFPSQALLSQVTAPVTSPQRELQTQSLLRKKALSWMVTHPLDELRLIPLKLIALNDNDGEAIPLWIDAQASSKHPVLTRAAQNRLRILADIGGYALLTAFLTSLVVFGKALWRRRPLLRGALAYFAVALVMYGFVFYGGFRYRAALEPLMLLVAAPLVARLWALRQQRLA